jgi:hypothetical protein
MDILIGLLLGFIMYVLPFMVSGMLIFFALALIVFTLSYCVPRSFARKFTNAGLMISLCIASILALPAYVYFVIDVMADRSRPEEDAMARLKHEMRRDGRDRGWPAGTITELEQWVEREGGTYKGKMQLEVASQISSLIDANKLETNDADFVLIEKLANRPHALDSYSIYLIASTIAYVHLSRNGFDDIGHPERFRRAAGHHPAANETDYTTYIKVAMVRCTQNPNSQDCRDTFTEDEVTRFQTESEGANTLNWYERLHVVEPLRAALGYPPLKK